MAEDTETTLGIDDIPEPEIFRPGSTNQSKKQAANNLLGGNKWFRIIQKIRTDICWRTNIENLGLGDGTDSPGLSKKDLGGNALGNIEQVDREVMKVVLSEILPHPLVFKQTQQVLRPNGDLSPLLRFQFPQDGAANITGFKTEEAAATVLDFFRSLGLQLQK